MVIHCWIQFAKLLFEFLPAMFKSDAGIFRLFSSNNVFVCFFFLLFFNQENASFIDSVEKFSNLLTTNSTSLINIGLLILLLSWMSFGNFCLSRTLYWHKIAYCPFIICRNQAMSPFSSLILIICVFSLIILFRNLSILLILSKFHLLIDFSMSLIFLNSLFKFNFVNIYCILSFRGRI